MRILLLDNYDSFVYNLVHIIRELGYGKELEVFRNDKISLDDVEKYDKILLSPGPGIPEEAGIMPELIKRYAPTKSIFGVCLGHQAIGAALGGRVSRAPELLHGKTSQVQHKNEGVFKDLKSPFRATRYHSLAIENPNFPNDLTITATTESGVIMGVKHKTAPIEGVQFHPESVLTEGGHRLLANWLETTGDKQAISVSATIPSVN